MDRTALRHAWDRLRRANGAYKRLVEAHTVADAEDAWSDFLMAASGVFAKLEKGAKGHPKAAPWYGTVKHERRTDPLLSYLHHARDADHHGIVGITKRAFKGARIGAAPAGGRVYGLAITDQGEVVHHPLNRGVAVDVAVDFVLTTVRDDLHGNTFAVPTTHLGHALPDQQPRTLAAAGLVYMDQLVRKASEFAAN